MNTPHPLIPQGSLLEQKSRSRSRVKLAFFCVLAIHVVGLGALLVVGCRREQPASTPESTDITTPPSTNMPWMDTTPPPVTAPPVAEETSTPPVAVAPPVVPTPTPTPAEPPVITPSAPSTTEYTVMKGDTLSGIGSKYGVSWKAIANANPNVDPKRLQIGQKLVIPPPSKPSPTMGNGGPGSTTTTPGGDIIYVVKSGDTLSKIASEYHTTYKEIKAANNLLTDRITVGQKLKIPVKETPQPAPGVATPVPGQP